MSWNSRLSIAAAGRGRESMADHEEVSLSLALAELLTGQPETFGYRLREALDEHLSPFKQRDIAAKLGVSEARISQLLNRRRNMTIDTIERLLIAANDLKTEGAVAAGKRACSINPAESRPPE